MTKIFNYFWLLWNREKIKKFFSTFVSLDETHRLEITSYVYCDKITIYMRYLGLTHWIYKGGSVEDDWGSIPISNNIIGKISNYSNGVAVIDPKKNKRTCNCFCCYTRTSKENLPVISNS